MRISDCSSDVCSSDLVNARLCGQTERLQTNFHRRLRHAKIGSQLRSIDTGTHTMVEQMFLLHRGDIGLKPAAPPAPAPTSVPPAKPPAPTRKHPPDRANAPAPRNRLPSATRKAGPPARSEEHTSELQSLMRLSYAVFC